MTISRNVTDMTTRIGDFLTGAQGDRSGALSVLNDILGPLPAPDEPSMLEHRAEEAGMLPLIRSWQEHDKAPHADESTIQALFRPTELERFSTQTGLSQQAAMKILREMLPSAIRHRALNARAGWQPANTADPNLH
ncbi:hypothetical protein HNW77_01540 [Komagataeibacter sp. AV436]|uniref:DUF937 domain-containing protein n=1 Tax=Komagataeibacter melomenusus TaxID=2766578 RepID=A0ABX2ABA2_9PROT|nr:YidB family protein [Komagataeibacter melomenusus]MBV1829690.1 hypothetical protein [Komagataeibacter melomenusus]NPC65109.1 hypothetical protein [Komagataeibacter melomenusus]